MGWNDPSIDKFMSSRQTVSIQGLKIPIRTEEDVSRLRDVVSYVDSRMQLAAESLPVKDPSRIAILASLNIAGELLAREGGSEDPLCRRLDRLSEQISGALNRLEEGGDSRT